jgi:N-acetyltransferase
MSAGFELQPILRGALVELQPLRVTDFEALYAVASDPKVWEQHPNPDRYTRVVFTEFFREAIESGAAFLVRDANDGRVIGSSRYHAYDARRREIEVGYTFLARSHWGGTYNHEMKQLLLRHAFLFVDRVLFVIGEQNLRSRRAIETIGATLVEIRERASGERRAIYAISATDFAAGLGARERFDERTL